MNPITPHSEEHFSNKSSFSITLFLISLKARMHWSNGVNSRKQRLVFVFLALLFVDVLFVFVTRASPPPPNLNVEYTQTAPLPGYAWEPVSFSAYVKNSGGSAAEPSVARLRVDAGRDGTWETVSSVPIRALALGEQRKVEWIDAVKLPHGTHAAEICADTGGVITETNESDNCQSLSFSLVDWYGALPGADRTLDIVFLGDRYPDMSPFYNDVAALKEYLASLAPYTEFASAIKFHIVENSLYLGCRETVRELYAPIDPPPTKPTGTTTTIFCDQSLVLEAVRRAGVAYDKIVVLASGMNGGTGFDTFVFTGKEKRLFAHELGHGFGLLDEYVSTSDTGPASDTCHANCCENLRCAAWSGIPGAQCVLGCTYPNWYRSSPASLMRYLNTEYFNPVSIEHLRKTINRYLERVPPTVRITVPANNAKISGITTIGVFAADENTIAKIELSVDGVLFARWYAAQATVLEYVTWDTIPLTPGSLHTLEATAYDLAGNAAVSAPVTMTIAPTLPTASPVLTFTSLPTPPATTQAPQFTPSATFTPKPSATWMPEPTQTPVPIISPYPSPLISDGDVIHIIAGKSAIYFVKIVGAKRFARKVIGDTLLLYPHLKPPYAKELYLITPIPLFNDLPAHAGYRLSAWVRLPITDDPETWKVWEVNDDGTKHWITCANPNHCATTWVTRGGDPDGVYTVNKMELDRYRTGPHVFLQ